MHQDFNDQHMWNPSKSKILELYYNAVKGDIVKYSNPHQIIIADGKAIQWIGIGPSASLEEPFHVSLHTLDSLIYRVGRPGTANLRLMQVTSMLQKYISFIIWKDFVLEYNSALNFEMKVQKFSLVQLLSLSKNDLSSSDFSAL